MFPVCFWGPQTKTSQIICYENSQLISPCYHSNYESVILVQGTSGPLNRNKSPDVHLLIYGQLLNDKGSTMEQ